MEETKIEEEEEEEEEENCNALAILDEEFHQELDEENDLPTSSVRPDHDCMLTFSVNSHPIAKLHSRIARTANLRPIHGRYRLGHTKLAVLSAVLTSTAERAIRTSRPSDALTVTTEDGTTLQIVAWGWDLDRHAFLAYLTW